MADVTRLLLANQMSADTVLILLADYISGIKQNGKWTVIDEGYFHVGAKFSVLRGGNLEFALGQDIFV